jgi:hypothetical protein
LIILHLFPRKFGRQYHHFNCAHWGIHGCKRFFPEGINLFMIAVCVSLTQDPVNICMNVFNIVNDGRAFMGCLKVVLVNVTGCQLLAGEPYIGNNAKNENKTIPRKGDKSSFLCIFTFMRYFFMKGPSNYS